MTNEEIAVLIQQGDSEKMALLWERIERFVAFRANRVVGIMGDRIKVEFDDLYNSGYLALVGAVESFDAEKGFSFLTWFDFYLRRVFAETAGYRNKNKFRVESAVVSLEAPAGEDDSITVEDTIADACNVEAEVMETLSRQELHDLLERALGELPPMEEDVLRRVYYEENTLEAVGEVYGLSRERIRQIKSSALRHIRSGTVRKDLEERIDWRTNWYARCSVKSQRSPVEETVIKREELRLRFQPKPAPNIDNLLEKYLGPQWVDRYNEALEKRLSELLEKRK